MSEFIDIILSNKIYLLILVCLTGAIVFLIIKKLLKLLVYAAIILLAFLAYIYYTGETVGSVLKPVEKALEKAGEAVK